MEERDAVPGDECLVVAVVGDHRDHVDGQVTAAGAVEQVVEAVAVAGHHDQNAAPCAHGFEVPPHGEGGGHGGEVAAQGPRHALAVGGGEADPHEEVSVAAVAELLVVDDVAAVLQQEPRDGVDDAGCLGAVEGQDVLCVG